MENPISSAIGVNIPIKTYRLGASRRNEASRTLALLFVRRVHWEFRNDINSHFDVAEYATRERVWKVLRMLDACMISSLGRPLSTSETRDTTSAIKYSASNGLCAIFEAILIKVYSKRMVSTEVLQQTSGHHREWR